MKRAIGSIFDYSIQLSHICSSVKHARLCTYRHITVFMFTHVHTTSNQDLFSAKSCLMSFIKPSHAFKLKLMLDSTDFPFVALSSSVSAVYARNARDHDPPLRPRTACILRLGLSYGSLSKNGFLNASHPPLKDTSEKQRNVLYEV